MNFADIFCVLGLYAAANKLYGIGRTFDFKTETVDALECLKSGQTFGKVVLDNSGNDLK